MAVAVGIVNRADKGLAQILHKAGPQTTAFHPQSLVDQQVLSRVRGGRPCWRLRRLCRLPHHHFALENMHLDIFGRRDIHGKFCSQVNDRALGSLDLETAGLRVHDFGTDLAGVQEDLAGGNQIQLGGALNDRAGSNVEIQFDGPRTKTDFLTRGKGGTQFRRRDRMAPAAVDRVGQAGHAGRGGERGVLIWDFSLVICNFSSAISLPHRHSDQSGHEQQRSQDREKRGVAGGEAPTSPAQIAKETKNGGGGRRTVRRTGVPDRSGVGQN